MHIIEKAKCWSKDLWLQSMSRLIIKPIPIGLIESNEFNTLYIPIDTDWSVLQQRQFFHVVHDHCVNSHNKSGSLCVEKLVAYHFGGLKHYTKINNNRSCTTTFQYFSIVYFFNSKFILFTKHKKDVKKYSEIFSIAVLYGVLH